MIWVDTDFGFDDLWALLLLKAHHVTIDGVSLVPGNVPLMQAKANALGANMAFDLNLTLFEGADRPLVREPETAEAILGPTGMQTRGLALPKPDCTPALPTAIYALSQWLMHGEINRPRTIIAIGPLTNIANLIANDPDAASRITRLIWMGGSSGRGNHTEYAEFNAFADPEAADLVMKANIPLDVVDLTLCRSVSFGDKDLPRSDALIADLLGGYLDIALERGRSSMAIYDPVAALAVIAPEDFDYTAMSMSTVTRPGDHYGQTLFTPDDTSKQRLLTNPPTDAARICLNALKENACDHGN